MGWRVLLVSPAAIESCHGESPWEISCFGAGTAGSSGSSAVQHSTTAAASHARGRAKTPGAKASYEKIQTTAPTKGRPRKPGSNRRVVAPHTIAAIERDGDSKRWRAALSKPTQLPGIVQDQALVQRATQKRYKLV